MTEQKAIQAAYEALEILSEACPEPGKQNTATNNVRRAIGQLKGAIEIEARNKAKSEEKERIAKLSERVFSQMETPLISEMRTKPEDKKALVALTDGSSLEIHAAKVEYDQDWVHLFASNGSIEASVSRDRVLYIRKQ